MKHLKDRTVDYFDAVWGGDVWEGQDLFVAHAHLHISPEMYEVCMQCGQAKNHRKIIGKTMAIIVAFFGPFMVKMYLNKTFNSFIDFFCFRSV